MKARTYHTLDGLRGVAAIAVVIFHLPGRPASWTMSGYLAVDLFFALSGFVIAHAYDDRLRTTLSIGEFLRARIVRLYPLLLLGLAFGAARGVALTAIHSPGGLSPTALAGTVALGLLLLPAPFGHDAELFPLNVPAWSLFYELGANALYGWLRPGRLMRVALVVCGALGVILTTITAGAIDQGHRFPEAIGGTSRVLFSFFAGVLIYRGKLQLPRIPVLVLLAVAGALLLLPVPSAFRSAYDIVFVLAASPAIIALGAGSEPLYVAPCQFLGRVSYPLYSVHWPILGALAFMSARVHLPAFPLGLAMTAGLVVLCPAIVRWYDEPARGWLRGVMAGSGRRYAAAIERPD